MIAFSTSWNSNRHTSGEEMLREIKALGFDLIELGHGIRISLVPGIQKMFDAGEVRFSSLHNFCPLPVEALSGSPDCYQMSAPDQSERDRAVKHTLQTIDLGVLGTWPGCNWGLFGAWLAMFADLVVRGALLFMRFLSGRWREIQV